MGEIAITRAEQILQALQTAIVQGDVAPGSKLNEPELSKRFGVSRGPIREAIRELAARGLVVVAPNAGARVVELSIQELTSLLETREALEGMAARLAASRMSAEELAELRGLLEQHGAGLSRGQGRGYYQEEGDYDFHYRILQGAKSPVLSNILLQELYQLTRMYRYKFSAASGRPEAALIEHRRIVEAIEARDGEMAELLMRRHIAAARHRLEAVAVRSEQP